MPCRRRADVAERVELHQTREHGRHDDDGAGGQGRGRAGARVELRPGSYHLMLIGLKRALTPGQTVILTLRFERAGAAHDPREVR